MSFQDFMSKVRQLDNRVAKWMMSHFYIIFFEFVLVIIFFYFFFNMLWSLDIANEISTRSTTEQLLLQQTTNTNIIIILLLLNSFWMLFMFNGMNRLRIILKDISFNLLRRKHNN